MRDLTLDYLIALEEGDEAASSLGRELKEQEDRAARAIAAREYCMRKWGSPTAPPTHMR